VSHVEDAATVVFANDEGESVRKLEVALRDDITLETNKDRRRSIDGISPSVTSVQVGANDRRDRSTGKGSGRKVSGAAARCILVAIVPPVQSDSAGLRGSTIPCTKHSIVSAGVRDSHTCREARNVIASNEREQEVRDALRDGNEVVCGIIL